MIALRSRWPSRAPLVALAAEAHVVGDREVEDDAARVAILGHVRHAPLLARAHRQPRHVVPVDEDAAAARLAPAGRGRRWRAPAPTGRCLRRRRRRGSRRRAPTGCTSSSARVPSSRVTVSCSTRSRSRASPAPVATLAGRGGGSGQIAPDHGARQFARGGAARIERRHHLAAPHDGDARGQRQHLVELVGDEDDRLAVGDEAAQHARTARRPRAASSTAVGSSRMSTSAPRHSTLTISTRCASPTDSDETQPPRLDAQPEALGELGDLALGPPRVDERPARRLAPEHHVLRHGQRRHQHEVLVHHADLARDRRLHRRARDRPRRRCAPRPRRAACMP